MSCIRSDRFFPRSVTEHLLESCTIGQTFRIKVMQPIRRVDGSERFPVVYATDADDFFDALAGLSATLQVLGELPRFVLVGIGYLDRDKAQLLRLRDLHSHRTRAYFEGEIRRVQDFAIYRGLVSFETITQTTDAKDFLSFIRECLIPLVATNYPVIRKDSFYWGHSTGAGFGLYTLFSEPDTFRHYVLGSPTTSYDGKNFALDMVKDFQILKRPISASVFMSVGELEETGRALDRFDLVTGLYGLNKYLAQAKIPGLNVTFRVFPGETHGSSWTLSFVQGLRAAFEPVSSLPFM